MCIFVTEQQKLFIMNLLQKLLLPTALLFILIFTVLILTFKHSLEINNEKRISNEIELSYSDITNSINVISNEAVFNSMSYSVVEKVKKEFYRYNKKQNIDSIASVLEAEYTDLSDEIYEKIGRKYDVAFYSTDGKNLYRSWSSLKGDESSLKRGIIREALNNEKTLSGLSYDSWGFAIYGITPVLGKSSEVLGFVETRINIEAILSKSNLDKNEDYMVLMPHNFIEEITKVNVETNTKYNNYVSIINSSKFKLENIDVLNKQRVFKKHEQKIIDNYVYLSMPILSYNKEELGLVLFQIDNTNFNDDKSSIRQTVLSLGIVMLLISSIIMIVLGRVFIKRPVRKVVNSLNILAEGGISGEVEIKTKDEIGEINKALNLLNKSFKRLSTFAKDIGEGNVDTEFKTLGEQDEIGISLLEMREKLLEAKKTDEIRKREDGQRNWATKGFADFGEILRQNNDNIEVFSSNIIKNLVKYTDSNQGGLFIINDNDENNIFLELVSVYAYDRKKFSEKEIKLGEGLIGTCAIEKETIYITDIPNNYLNITSGLGQSNPRNILIIPLKVDDVMFGVIELASFNLYENYKIEFIEKLAESISSSLSTAKVNIVTAQLLEQSKQQQEEMKAQEEELRQNMEEMLATQEEAAKKESEAEGLYNAVRANTLLAELDFEGKITDINDNFAKVLDAKRNELMGVNYFSLNIDFDDISKKDLLQKCQNNETVSVKTILVSSSGTKVNLNQTFSPIKDMEGNIYKIINFAYINENSK